MQDVSRGIGEKVNQEYIEQAVADLAILKFFPSGPGEQVAIMRLLLAIVDTPEHLAWLVKTLMDYIGEWPGPAQLRALYATRYRPADGIEGPHCTIAGFTPCDSERESLEGHENIKRLEIKASPRIGGILPAGSVQ